MFITNVRDVIEWCTTTIGYRRWRSWNYQSFWRLVENCRHLLWTCRHRWRHHRPSQRQNQAVSNRGQKSAVLGCIGSCNTIVHENTTINSAFSMYTCIWDPTLQIFFTKQLYLYFRTLKTLIPKNCNAFAFDTTRQVSKQRHNVIPRAAYAYVWE